MAEETKMLNARILEKSWKNWGGKSWMRVSSGGNSHKSFENVSLWNTSKKGSNPINKPEAKSSIKSSVKRDPINKELIKSFGDLRYR